MDTYQVPSSFRDKHEEKVFWSKIMADQKRSGMGMRRFCQHHQINFSRLGYWKYGKSKNVSNSKRKKNRRNVNYDEKDIGKFIPLHVAHDLSDEVNRQDCKDEAAKIELLFKNGHRLILLPPINENYLFLAIKILSRL